MKGLDARVGAVVLSLLGASYFAAAAATGHSARSEAPLDLRAQAHEAGLDAMKAAALLVEDKATLVMDTRSPRDFALYHVPGAQNEPDASPSRIAQLAKSGAPVIVVASRDDLALALVEGARQAAPGQRIHFLKDGVRAFYLTFELPVPLFSDTAAPYGYDEAVATVRLYLTERSTGDAKAAADALDRLARTAYRPTLLKGGPGPKAGGAQKKISGGCG